MSEKKELKAQAAGEIMAGKKEKKTDFASPETRGRLLAAIVASLMEKNVKLDYKEIHKFFGESTPDGLEFQFRGIKRSAEVLREAAASGNSPVAAFAEHVGKGSAAKASTTPKPATPTSSRRNRATPARSGGSAKRRKVIKAEFTDDEDSPDENYDEKDTSDVDESPRVIPTPKNGIPLPDHALWKKPPPGTPRRGSSFARALAAKTAGRDSVKSPTNGTTAGTTTGFASAPTLAPSGYGSEAPIPVSTGMTTTPSFSGGEVAGGRFPSYHGSHNQEEDANQYGYGTSYQNQPGGGYYQHHQPQWEQDPGDC
ncbi:hypothetical protein VTK56DRAFT_723 [Thermocarpiscus australiensis]